MAGFVALICLAALGSYSPSPEIGFVLQIMGLGGALGLAAALALDLHRGPDADRWRHLIAGFTLGGAILGFLIVAGDALAGGP